jgi:stearoyl-CoA desaturase (Delta-9 desaturase)
MPLSSSRESPMSAPLAALLAYGLTGSSWTTVLVFFLVVTQLTIFSVTLYLHRSAAHRGVDFHPLLAHGFRFWTWLTTAMVTKEWVAIHRKHHAKCETEDDPHSPQVHGINKVVFHGVTLYQNACNDREMIEKYGLGTPDDWVERNVYARAPAAGPTLMLFVDLALFGAVGLVIWAVQMLWIPVMAAGVVNGLGHWWGYRNFETADRATNLTPWGVFIGGEELHNNHHAFPSSAKFSQRGYEFDIGWAMLRVFERLRLAKVLRVAPKLELRPLVEVPDTETVKAVMAHRFHVMTSYFRGVIVPTLQAEARSASDSVQRLTGRLRRALSSDGRWLDSASRERLSAWIDSRPMLARVYDYRRRLNEVLERSGKTSDALLQALQDWCADAERSGIAQLEEFARRLRGYQLKSALA